MAETVIKKPGIIIKKNKKVPNTNLDGTLKYNEKELIEMLQKKDQQAFAYLYDNYAGAMRGIIYSMVENREQAENILQEAFVNIWKNFSSYDTSKGRLFTWMLNITRNLVIDTLRSKGYKKQAKISSDENFVKEEEIEKRVREFNTFVKPKIIFQLRPENKLSEGLGTIRTIKRDPDRFKKIYLGFKIKKTLATAEIDNETDQDYINLIRKCIPKKSIDYLVKATEIPVAEMAEIMETTPRKLAAIKPNTLMEKSQSEKAVHIARLYALGEEVFGSTEEFNKWMNGRVPVLGKKKPKEYLDTTLGINLLMDELVRIQHGVYS